MTYGKSQHGYVAHSSTSREAAEALEQSGHGNKQAERIMFKLALNAAHGATGDELATFLQGSGFPNIQNNTVAARLIELEM